LYQLEVKATALLIEEDRVIRLVEEDKEFQVWSLMEQVFHQSPVIGLEVDGEGDSPTTGTAGAGVDNDGGLVGEG